MDATEEEFDATRFENRWTWSDPDDPQSAYDNLMDEFREFVEARIDGTNKEFTKRYNRVTARIRHDALTATAAYIVPGNPMVLRLYDEVLEIGRDIPLSDMIKDMIETYGQEAMPWLRALIRQVDEERLADAEAKLSEAK